MGGGGASRRQENACLMLFKIIYRIYSTIIAEYFYNANNVVGAYATSKSHKLSKWKQNTRPPNWR